MEHILTGAQMKKLDTYTIEEMGIPSLVLMERAGLAVFEEMKKAFLPLSKILVLCGSGNNGADGIVIARLLFLEGYDVDVCILGSRESFTEEMKKQVEIGKKYGISFVNSFLCSEYTTIVDAVFGIGLSRRVSGKYKEIFKEINESSGKVVAVDIPSGIHADTGAVMGEAVKADLTVTFAYKKAGLCLYPGAAYAGRLITRDIGIYAQEEFLKIPALYACEKEDIWALKRKPDGHKGTFGRIFLVAGSRDIFGAAYLSGLAAMKAGAGMLKICTREENRSMFSCFPEAMVSVYNDDTDLEAVLAEGIAWADVLGIGPGLGISKQAADILDILLTKGKKPMVIDADGLNLLKGNTDKVKAYQGEVILTPHLGEFCRITGVSPEEWRKDPVGITQKYAKELQAVLVCKDARTIIAGSEDNVYLNLTGNDGMATAGSGDVLTGIILGFLAQKKTAQESAYMAVFLHGMAGDLAAERVGKPGMLAKDIIEAEAEILKEGNHYEDTK